MRFLESAPELLELSGRDQPIDYQPGEQESYHLALRGGVELPVSRLRLERLRELLQAPHPRSDAQRPSGG